MNTHEFNIYKVGKIDPSRHLSEKINEINENIVFSNFGLMINSKIF